MSMFGLFGNARVEAEAQQLVETRWRNAQLMLNGDNVSRQQEVMFKLMLGEVVEEQLRNERQLKLMMAIVGVVGVETTVQLALTAANVGGG